MTARTEPRNPGDISDVAGTIAELIEQAMFREAEVVIAFLTLWILDRIESGLMTGPEADAVFTMLDVRLSDLSGGHGDRSISNEAQELIFEGEHLHHFGEMDGPTRGPDPAYLRRLAFIILQRSNG